MKREIQNRVSLAGGFHGPYRKPGLSCGLWRLMLVLAAILVPIYVIAFNIWLKW